ncbi:MAG: hypothetical protein IPO71_12870 [Nitrosomonas sp.]|nr:hypothetical protein [Nitrosomonas sp.]
MQDQAAAGIANTAQIDRNRQDTAGSIRRRQIRQGIFAGHWSGHRCHRHSHCIGGDRFHQLSLGVNAFGDRWIDPAISGPPFYWFSQLRKRNLAPLLMPTAGQSIPAHYQYSVWALADAYGCLLPGAPALTDRPYAEKKSPWKSYVSLSYC